MQLNDLRPAEGAKKARKRIGRGNSSGHGTTAGRGTKGQLSRSGGGKGAGFEGGQQPLAMRLPKLPGFRNHGRVEYTPVNVPASRKVQRRRYRRPRVLIAAGVIKRYYEPVKVLADGELTKKLTVKVDKVTPPPRPRSRPPAERSSRRAKRHPQRFPRQELRNKILLTVGILVLYRIGAYVPVPGAPFPEMLRAYQSAPARTVLSRF